MFSTTEKGILIIVLRSPEELAETLEGVYSQNKTNKLLSKYLAHVA